MTHKLYNLLDYPNLNYAKKELVKISKLLKFMTAKDLLFLLNHIKNIFLITEKNWKDLLKFARNKESFFEKKVVIKWGNGNHKDPYINLIEHYKKHVKCETEGVYWEGIGLEEYRDFPLLHFYEMENVFVHSHGGFVHLSGFYGNVFIVGRYEGNEFGISSCYYVESGRKEGRESGKCIEF